MNKLFLLLALVVVLLSACASPTTTPVPAPKVSVENVWGRTSPSSAQNGAFYVTLRNTGSAADKLTAVKTTACGMAELHESYQLDNGTMGMRPVTGGVIDVPAGGSVELKAGGLHIMCMMKKVAFDKGVKIPLTFVFEKAGELSAEAEIRE